MTSRQQIDLALAGSSWLGKDCVFRTETKSAHTHLTTSSALSYLRDLYLSFPRQTQMQLTEFEFVKFLLLVPAAVLTTTLVTQEAP